MTDTPTDVTTQLAELEATAHKAEDDVRAAHAQRDDVRKRQGDLQDERRRLHSEEPSQFDADGLPKPKTRAAEVVGEDERLSKADLRPMIEGAEERARQARRAVTDFMRDNHVELAEALKPQAEALVTEYRRHLQGIADTVENWFTLSQRSSELLGPVQGLGGDDIPLGDHLSSVRRTALRELKEPVPLPLSRTLVPQPDFPSPRVMGPKGDGYISIANADGDQTGTVKKRSATPVFKRYGNTNRATRPPAFL